MKLGCATVFAIGVVALVLLAFVGSGGPTACLALADHAATQADALRAAARSGEGGDADLCEGLALLAEQKGSPASGKLAVAMARAEPKDRWSVQGHYALALSLSGRDRPALQHWQAAIAAGEQAGNLDRANLFRGARAMHFAIRKQYDEALKDFEVVYRRTGFDEVRASAGYAAFKVVTLDGDQAKVAHWFPLAFDALDEVGDAEKLAYATEIYGQMLDDRGDFDVSAAVYRKGIDATDGWGEEYWHAELLEFAGQSRFAAGDFAGGGRFYGEAAAMFRQAGEAEYAEHVEKNLRAMRGRRAIEMEIAEP